MYCGVRRMRRSDTGWKFVKDRRSASMVTRSWKMLHPVWNGIYRVSQSLMVYLEAI